MLVFFQKQLFDSDSDFFWHFAQKRQIQIKTISLTCEQFVNQASFATFSLSLIVALAT